METIIRCPHCGAKNRIRPTSEGVPRCARCKNKLPWVVPADEASFDEEIRASVPVVVDFWAPWCAPCRMIDPVLQAMAQDHAGRLKVVKVNIDEHEELARRFQAMSIPLVVGFRDGKEVERVVGALPRAQLEQRLASLLDGQGREARAGEERPAQA
jgi:thioredoxin 2